MPDWAAFALATVVLTAVLLFLTRRSQSVLREVSLDDASDAAGGVDADERSARPTLTTTLLLANVAGSQAVALSALVAVAWWTEVPAAAFGVAAGPVVPAVGLGLLAGVGLYAGSEAAAALGARAGTAAPERLREAMAPTDARDWVLLLAVVLPVVAVFEEALFRGALVGAFAVGFGIDPWLLVVPASVAFGLGHGAQGRLGIAVTGVLGVVLAALFVRTGSLLVVVVAHYVVNATEFVVREGLGVDPLAAVSGARSDV